MISLLCKCMEHAHLGYRWNGRKCQQRARSRERVRARNDCFLEHSCREEGDGTMGEPCLHRPYAVLRIHDTQITVTGNLDACDIAHARTLGTLWAQSWLSREKSTAASLSEPEGSVIKAISRFLLRGTEVKAIRPFLQTLPRHLPSHHSALPHSKMKAGFLGGRGGLPGLPGAGARCPPQTTTTTTTTSRLRSSATATAHPMTMRRATTPALGG